MKDPLPFELLMVRSLYSIVDTIEHISPSTSRLLEPTRKELAAFESDWYTRQSFEETH